MIRMHIDLRPLVVFGNG